MVTETVEFSVGLESTKPGYEVKLSSLLTPTLGTEVDDNISGTANSDFIRTGPVMIGLPAGEEMMS
jgi:hypothetical protein